MSRLIKGLASAAVLAGVGLAAQPAEAAPFLTVNLVGRVQGSGTPFSSTVNIAPGQTLQYAVEYQLAPAGTTNPFIGSTSNATQMQTINSWAPSPLNGLNSLFFSLNQPAGNSGITVDFNPANLFNASTTPTPPPILDPDDPPPADPASSSWAAGSGSSPGTVTPRGDGNDNLTAVQLYRVSGNHDGIANNGSLETIRLGSGTVPVVGGSGPSTLNINLNGYPFNPQQPNPFVAGFQFRNAANNGDIIATPTLSEQQASVLAGDPIIVYNSLTLVPEPATLGVLGTVGAIGLLARRRRVH